MSASYCLMVADNLRPPGGSAPRRNLAGTAEYEPEHSERQVSGSVAVGTDCRWLGSLAVPMTGEQSALVTIEREGPTPPGAPVATRVELVIPPGELDAVLVLLRGLIAQARGDRVLPRRSAR
jgi:hypothetical protein